MTTAQQLYNDILNFLARGTAADPTAGPYKLSTREPLVKPSDWNELPPTTVKCQLLPLTTIGKGELSVQAALYAYLVSKDWIAVTEAAPDTGSDRADILVLDNNFTPLAAIELKHHSIHQPWQRGTLPLLDLMDEDLKKRTAQSFYGQPRPLIRIGLMTAIVSPTAKVLRTPSPPCFPSFLRRESYIARGTKDSLFAFKAPSQKNSSAQRFSDFIPAVQRWHKTGIGHAGWGPLEKFRHDPSGADIVGCVGYVCVMP
ncbi:hypothetical protein OPU71_16945 [Niveibacterium sp. 24ML]|uniref:hypothetical protein n=1 Tax=Niveibacterium sp. 24ML TaxID=2985512 RepID=UPI002271E0AF|nr:hypothetical protein [Niveibacterium sp. 24ML]MCX9157813.1 hypothetical protein [Niveibacterium sp. 24ML]